jgi:hypothetical protein
MFSARGLGISLFNLMVIFAPAAFAGENDLALLKIPEAQRSNNIVLVDVNWAKCYVRQSDRVLIISNGDWSRERCHELAKRCTGDQNVTSHFSSQPVLVNENFAICNAN